MRLGADKGEQQCREDRRLDMLSPPLVDRKCAADQGLGLVYDVE